MRFNPDLARQVMLLIEAAPANEPSEDIEVPGFSEDEINEHIELLDDAVARR